MDKVKQWIMYCVLILTSCNQTAGFNNDYDILFVYVPFTTIDFNTGILKTDFHDLKITRTLSLSEDERKRIIESFDKNKVYKVKGEVEYFSKKIIETPMSKFGIKVYYKGELQSETSIDDNISIDDGLKGQEYRLVRFRDVVLGVLESQKEFKEAQKEFMKYISDNRIFLP